jgi:hypothetical protein
MQVKSQAGPIQQSPSSSRLAQKLSALELHLLGQLDGGVRLPQSYW